MYDIYRSYNPDGEPPPAALYDTDATVQEVAEFYATEYGYATITPEPVDERDPDGPRAFYRSGDIAADLRAIQPMLNRIHLHPDVSKGKGRYKGATIRSHGNSPRVSISRPYFDVTTNTVVDRTLILMMR